MYDKHKHGKASEFYVSYILTNLNYDITLPYGNPRWDIIIEDGQNRLVAQIKSVVRKGDEIKVNLRGNDDNKGYNSEEVDLIIVHEREDNKIYYVPIYEVENKLSVLLRINPPPHYKHPSTKLAKNYEDFEEIKNKILVHKTIKNGK